MELNTEMERRNYDNNLQNFIDNIKNSFVELISFEIDPNPTFDKSIIPFEFKYCNSINIITDKTKFDIHSSPTDSGLETFWITQSSEKKPFSSYIQVGSRVNNIEFKNGIDNYAFKIKIEFENMKFNIYSGEIYDTANGDFDYKINDEMILLFENEKEAEIFENIISGQMKGNT